MHKKCVCVYMYIFISVFGLVVMLKPSMWLPTLPHPQKLNLERQTERNQSIHLSLSLSPTRRPCLFLPVSTCPSPPSRLVYVRSLLKPPNHLSQPPFNHRGASAQTHPELLNNTLAFLKGTVNNMHLQTLS